MQNKRFKPRVLVALGWNDPRTILAIGHYARDAGWHLETRQFFTDTIPLHWTGEGLIVSNSQRPELLEFIRKQAPLRPTVLIHGNQPGIRAPQVMEDNREIGRLAAKHFLNQGHKHFAWFGLHPGPVDTDRLDGFRSTLAEAGFDCHVLKPTGKRTLSAELRGLPRPLACFVLDDQFASDLIESCLSEGLRIPEDIAVIGVGNIEIACECSHIPISSIDPREEEIGRRAAVLLDRLMKGGKPPVKPIVIAPRGVVIRKSTDFLAVTDPVLRKAIDFVSENLESLPSLDDVAASAGVSRRTLYHLFQHDLRRTPAEFIRRLRLTRAQELLATPGLSITDAARKCGFASTQVLSRYFNEREGVSTRKWRKLQNSPH